MSYFDPEVLAKIKSLYLRTRFIVDGFMTGIHPSRAKGLSSEFEEHREYSQGDDVRRIDWKTYGKFDRYFIKEYHETTNLKAHIILDTSSSMNYGSNGWSKFDYASTLVASISYLMIRQQDQVGLILFSDKIEKIIPPKSTHGYIFSILKELEGRKPDGKTQAGKILQELAGSIKKRGLILFVSDLLDEPDSLKRGLRQLRSRGNDIIVFHILDKDELEFNFNESAIFEDMEENSTILIDPSSIRTAYIKIINSLIEDYKKTCASNLIDYSLFDTSYPLDHALSYYLNWRKRFRYNP